jgi:Ca2+-binding EF-hand superfamily protein
LFYRHCTRAQFFNAFSYRSSLLSSWIQSDLADLKIYWAFRIFDFDNDNKITQDDMEIAVALMAGDRRVTREQIAAIAAAVIREGDQDDSNSISRTEFKRVLQRVPDFQWYVLVLWCFTRIFFPSLLSGCI